MRSEDLIEEIRKRYPEFTGPFGRSSGILVCNDVW